MLEFLELGKGKDRDVETERFLRLEAKVNLILDHLGIDWRVAVNAAGLSDEVKSLANDGRKIDAIKLYRAESGASLNEAKQAVETYLDSRPDPADW